MRPLLGRSLDLRRGREGNRERILRAEILDAALRDGRSAADKGGQGNA